MAVKPLARHRFASSALALAGALSLGIISAQAAESLFGHLEGYWSGAGTVTMNNGSSDRIRCKASYAIRQDGNALEQNLSCASDSYKMQVNASVISRGGSISGTWSEATRGVTGNLSGTATGTDVRANVAGTGFTASLNLATHGDKQTVTIRPQGATDIVNVAINLRKQ